jgi:hypothetical protein
MLADYIVLIGLRIEEVALARLPHNARICMVAVGPTESEDEAEEKIVKAAAFFHERLLNNERILVCVSARHEWIMTGVRKIMQPIVDEVFGQMEERSPRKKSLPTYDKSSSENEMIRRYLGRLGRGKYAVAKIEADSPLHILTFGKPDDWLEDMCLDYGASVTYLKAKRKPADRLALEIYDVISAYTSQGVNTAIVFPEKFRGADLKARVANLLTKYLMPASKGGEQNGS